MWLVRPMCDGVTFLPGLGTDKVSRCSVWLVEGFPLLSLGLRLLRNWFVEDGKTVFHYSCQGWSFRRLQDDVFSNESLNMSVSMYHPPIPPSIDEFPCVYSNPLCFNLYKLLLNILSLNDRELHRNKINLIEPAAFNGLTKLERL